MKIEFFIVLSILLLCGCQENASSISQGRKIYNEGILSDGSEMKGIGDGGGSLSGAIVSCAKCHRKSGFGSVEGNVYVPPIVSQFLFDDYVVERKDMIRSLFQEEYNLQDAAKIRQLEHRPSYDFNSLKKLIVEGIDIEGNTISQTMPRYDIKDEDLIDLMAYLRALNSVTPEGVSNDSIHFATVITEDLTDQEENVLNELISAYVNWKNRNVIAQNKAAEGPEFHRGAFRGTYQNWKIHIWKLEGDSGTWEDQLKRKYKEQPVFSFISGFSHAPWEPIHRFAEINKIPSIFPNTQLPFELEEDYNLYFTQGVKQEISLIADYLKLGQKSLILLTDHGDVSKVILDSFDDLKKEQIDYLTIDINDLKPGAIKAYADREAMDSVYVLLALDRHSLTKLCHLSLEIQNNWIWVMHSGLINKGDHCLSSANQLFTSPFRIDERDTPRNHRIHAWMRSRGIIVTNEVLQMNTYFALSVADFALAHMIDHYSRNYFIEKIEHETENNLSPGIYPRMSLGPGQRFASRQLHLIRRTSTGESIVL